MSAAIVDKFIQGFDKDKVVFIVTGKCDKVKQAILENLGRGVTYLYGEGAYTGDKKKVIYCILSPRNLEQAKSLIKDIDSSAMISVMDTEEVRGNGFKAAAF